MQTLKLKINDVKIIIYLKTIFKKTKIFIIKNINNFNSVFLIKYNLKKC